jgi:hypothetical protein
MKRQILVLMAGLVLFVTGANAYWIDYIVTNNPDLDPYGNSWSGRFEVSNPLLSARVAGNVSSVSADLPSPPSLPVTVTTFDYAGNVDLVSWGNNDVIDGLKVSSLALYNAVVISGDTWVTLFNKPAFELTPDFNTAYDDPVVGPNAYTTYGGTIQFFDGGPSSAVPEPGMAGLAIFGGLLVVGVGRWVKGGSQKSPVAA